jgi:sugar phosphate isomerase/epimerase
MTELPDRRSRIRLPENEPSYSHAMKTSRRDFVKQAFGAVMATSVFQPHLASRLPISFSTLGCPAWNLGKILDFAEQNGYAAIELRGLEGNLDLPSHVAFSAQNIGQTKRAIASHGLRIACVSSSTSLHESDAAKRNHELSDARRFIDLAESLGSPFVRVFGNSPDAEKPIAPDKKLKELVASGLHELGEYGAQHKVTVLIESHDDFTSSADLGEVLQRANSAHVGLLWDAYHTFVGSNEDPESTVGKLHRWIHHTHLKDAAGSGNDRKYVLTGQGNIPIRRQITALRSAGYQGFYCFEWEKLWHPDLADPEIAIADFARAVGGYLRQ